MRGRSRAETQVLADDLLEVRLQWLFTLNRRRDNLFSGIESDLEASMQASVRRHDEDMGRPVRTERPLAPTFEELELAL